MQAIGSMHSFVRKLLASVVLVAASVSGASQVHAEPMPQELVVALDEYLNAKRRTFKAFAIRRPTKSDDNWYFAAAYDAGTAEKAAQQAETDCAPSMLEPCTIFALGDSIVDGFPAVRMRSAIQDYERDPKQIQQRHRLPDALQVWRARQAGRPEPAPSPRYPSADMIRAFDQYRRAEARTYKAFAFRPPDPFDPTWLFAAAYDRGSAEIAADQAIRACTQNVWRACHILALGPNYVAKYPQQDLALATSHYQADTKRPFRGRGLPHDLVKAWASGDLDGGINSLFPSLEIDFGQRQAARSLKSLFGSAGKSTRNANLIGVPLSTPGSEAEVLSGTFETNPPAIVKKTEDPPTQQSSTRKEESTAAISSNFPRYPAERFAVTYMSDASRDAKVALEYISRIRGQARGIPDALEEAATILVYSVIALESGDYKSAISSRGELSNLISQKPGNTEMHRVLSALDGFMFQYLGESEKAENAFRAVGSDGSAPPIVDFLRQHASFASARSGKAASSEQSDSNRTDRPQQPGAPKGSGSGKAWEIPKF